MGLVKAKLTALPKYALEKPYICFDAYAHGASANVETAESEVEIHDVRGREHDFNYEQHGFRFRKLNVDTEFENGTTGLIEYLEKARCFCCRRSSSMT